MKDRAGSPPADFAERIKAALVSRIGATRYQMWFQQHTSFVPAGRELVVAVPSEYFQGWIDQAFGDVIRASAAEVLGGEPRVRFVVDAGLFDTPPAEDAQPAPAVQSAKPEKKAAGPAPEASYRPKTRPTLFGVDVEPPPSSRTRKPAEKREKPDSPSPSGSTSRTRRWRSLADFVVGACNRVAHASALSVIEEPGEAANPLVIHGPVGTGKTHLLEGIYAGLRKMHPDERPSFITAEEFTTRFVQASRYEKHGQFRRQFRECSALLIDDLHFLATKPGTQKEFVHTLDSLLADGRQIVVTTDCHPRLADDLMPELVDRLLAGAIWPLQPPDETTRLDILRKKAGLAQPPISDAVLKTIARSLHGNVRELEGAINSVRHYSKVVGKPVDQALVREALGDLLRHSVRAISIADVDAAVCAALKLSSGVLQSKARSWSVSHPRMIAMFLCRKHTAGTYGEIAKHFGAKTHSTAVAAEKKVRSWVKSGDLVPVGDREWAISELLERIDRELQR